MTKNIFLILLFFSITIFAQDRLWIDDTFQDWQDVTTVHNDPSGDNGGGLDLGVLKVTSDENYLYIMFSVDEEINIQDNNNLKLLIDTDNDAATGLSRQGIGAELEYDFGRRSGTFHNGNSSERINWVDIEMITSPTVTSDTFEIAINRSEDVNGTDLFPENTIRIAMQDASSGGDLLPDSPGGVSYSFDNSITNVIPDYTVLKAEGTDFRVMSYNVERDKFFNDENKPAFERILTATVPDIIGFQEIYEHSAQETAALVEEYLPMEEGEWYYAKENPDIICVSRYPIKASYPIEGTSSSQGNGAFVIELPEEQGEILFISAHTPCCDNNEGRQHEVDAIMAFIRDAKNEGGVLDIAEDTPVIIVGDMNLVGYNEQLHTFLTGDIKYENAHGQDFVPDWDGTDMEDAKPFATGRPMAFSWYDPGSGFGPGRLDFVFYTGSVIEKINSYTLFTPGMDTETLNQFGLQANDVLNAADHNPLVVDFRFVPETGIKGEEDKRMGYNLGQNFPNPFNPASSFTYTLPEESEVVIKLFDITGEEVDTLLNRRQVAGSHTLTLNAGKLSSGVYLYTMAADGYRQTKKMVVLK